MEEPSRCPSADEVRIAVRLLLGPTTTDARAEKGAFAVRDLGDRYRVEVQGRSREYVDKIRDCAARSRAAAVFVALTLEPSGVVLPGETRDGASDMAADRLVDTAPPPPVARQSDRERADRERADRWRADRWHGQIEVGVLGATAPRGGGSEFVAGVELRLVTTTTTWGLSLGAALPTQATFEATSVQVRERRYPIDIGVRRFWTRTWIGGGVDIGALAAICRLGQTDRPDSTKTQVELGVRAAATLAANFTRFELYIRAFSEFIPITRQIAIEPQGIIGRTSPIWIGATVGLAARFY